MKKSSKRIVLALTSIGTIGILVYLLNKRMGFADKIVSVFDMWGQGRGRMDNIPVATYPSHIVESVSGMANRQNTTRFKTFQDIDSDWIVDL